VGTWESLPLSKTIKDDQQISENQFVELACGGLMSVKGWNNRKGGGAGGR